MSQPCCLTRPLLFATMLVALVLVTVASTSAHAQKVFTIDTRASLAWWQVNPHLKHLWGTTCPGDPSWRPGEGVSMAQAQSLLSKAYKRTGYAAVIDTVVPLYPRRRVRSVCEGGVTGQITADEGASWRGVRGFVAVRPEYLTSGLKLRDAYTDDLLNIQRYPEIRFRIDSLTAVQPGDTLRANAVGVFSLNGVNTPMSVPVRAWNEAGGLRVQGKFDIPARELIETYNLSKWKLGLGVQTNIWQILHLGFDVLLRESPAPSKAAQ